MSNTTIDPFVRFAAMITLLVCTICSTTLASAQEPYAGVEIQEEHLPEEGDEGWRLELAAGLEGGMGKNDCSQSDWICFGLYGGGAVSLGFSTLPAFSAALRTGLWGYSASDDAASVGAEARFRPVQLFKSWADYAGNSMHALTLGVRADLLLEEDESWGDYRGIIGYEYRSSFGLLFRLESALGIANNGARTEFGWGSNIALGGYF